MTRPDREEKELLDSFERGEWRTIADTAAEKERYAKYARATFKKDKRANINIVYQIIPNE